MENSTIKDKIFYWGGVTLISSIIIGGSYYIYKSIINPEENDNNSESDNNSLNNNSFEQKLKEENKINNNIINEENFSNKINSSIFPINKNENEINTNNNDLASSNNIISKYKEIKIEDENKEIENNPINIFSNNKLLLTAFGINIDESKLFNNINNKLTDEGTVRLIIYINFLAEKFYLIDNEQLDNKRRELLIKNNNNKNIIENSSNNIINEKNLEQLNNDQNLEEYLSICNETILCKQRSYQIAAEKILNSLKIKINFQQFEEFLKLIDAKKLEELSIKIMVELNDELFKYDLDYLDINKTREAYIDFLTTYINEAKNIYEQQQKLNNDIQNSNIEESNSMLIFHFMTLKMRMDDQIYLKYKIVDEHLKLLVHKYNLLTDNEINKLQNEFDDMNNKFVNIK